MFICNLPPPPTSFIGREPEIGEIVERLGRSDCRLLTLVGPGGIGKTRLAIEAGHRLCDAFANGVYFVSLAPLQSAESIIPAIAQAINLHFHGDRTVADVPVADERPPVQQLHDFLREKQALLLVDNFEHLLDGTPILIDLLAIAPGVKFLATSREVLNLHAEWVYHVRGMRFPEDGVASDANDYSAVKLFVERARRVRHDFSLAEEQNDVIHICRLVEGMPLGIELAAAWLRMLSCADIVTEIRRSVDFLATNQPDVPPRHRSIRAVFQQSWNMLTEAEQAAYRRLSVFRGGFTTPAAQAVTGASLLVLSALADKSLLQPVAPGRCDVHELLLQYAEEQLRQSGEADAAHNAHSEYYLNFLAEREPDSKGRNQRKALDNLEADFENIRAAWVWAVDRRNYTTLDQALESLDLLCAMRLLEEGTALLQYAREKLAPQDGEAPHPVWGRVLIQPKRTAERRLVEQALEIARQHDSPAEIAKCYSIFADWAFQEKDFEAALVWQQRSLDLFREVGDRYWIAWALRGLAFLSPVGYHDEEDKLAAESLALAREIGDQVGIAYALNEFGGRALFYGRYAEAERIFAEATALGRDIGDRTQVSWVSANWGFCLLMLGNLKQAWQVTQEALDLAFESGYVEDKRWATVVSAWLACAEGDYRQGRRRAEDALKWLPVFRPDVISAANLVLAQASIGLGEWPVARRSSQDALEYVAATHFPRGNTLLYLPAPMLLLANDATKTDEKVRIAELLGLIFSHPASPKAYFEMEPLLNRLRADLRAVLGDDVYDTAWERGATLDLEAVVAEVLQELQTVPDVSDALAAIHAANQTLADPLTERELEVLHHIAGGLSNPEIADRLYVGLSTVKKHINHIYSKLDVDNRAGAITRAGELNLLY